MSLDVDQLNRTTLLRQGLLERTRVDVDDAIRRFGPLQSQNPATPYLALWNRIDGFEADALDIAYRTAAVVKASLIRLTLHTVCQDDHATYRAAMLPNLRGAGLGDRRFTDTGLSTADADDLVERLGVALAEPRSRRDIEAELTSWLGYRPGGGLWRALRFIAPWRHQPGEHPWSFGDPARFVAVDLEPVDHLDAVAHVIRRYLTAFGPATRRDIGQFTILRLAVVDEALERVDGLISRLGADGALFDVEGAPLAEIADVAEVPVRLLPMWDNTLLAYADRSRMIPDEYRPHVIRRNGDVLPTLLVDGRVAGVWRFVDGAIEVKAFGPLRRATLDAIEREAAALGGFIDRRDPATYRRYHRWWDGLPVASRTVVAAASV